MQLFAIVPRQTQAPRKLVDFISHVIKEPVRTCSIQRYFDRTNHASIDSRYRLSSWLVMASSVDLTQGTLDPLILGTIELRPLHGVGITDRIAQATRAPFQVAPGSLFAALHRLAEKGLIEGEWREVESGRRPKVYALTALGRKHLDQEKLNWKKLATAVAEVLKAEG